MWRLQHHTNPRLDAVQRQLGVIFAVNTNHPLAWFIESTEQIDNRAFTATCRADQCDCFTRFDIQIEIIQHRFIFIIVESHVIELNRPSNRAGINCIFSIHNIRFRIQQRKTAFCRSNRMLHGCVNTRHILYREHHENDERHKCLNPTDGHAAQCKLPAAICRNRTHSK